MMKLKVAYIRSVLFCFTLLFSGSLSFAQTVPVDNPEAVAKGEALFKAQCYTCHRIKEKWTGPALGGYETRVPSIAWTIAWVKNSAKVIASGDEYANKIYNEWNKSQMTAFTNLKDEDILNILAYVEVENKKVAAPIADTTTGGTGAPAEAGIPSAYLNAIIIGLVLILVLLLIILGFIISALKRFLHTRDLAEEDKEVVDSPITLGSITRSPGFVFLIIFVVATVSFKTVIDGLYSIGIQQGYAPTQPIKFSHALHAGQYEIQCQYCHTGVMKGKQANIPSPNICMNCHTQIKTESAEIKKIYASIGYDPATGTYSGKQEPIRWVRIHNLPDLAYFNHAQHTNVAGIACQTCHGPIEEMEVVYQYSLLTMGWCIDCHRKTDVNTQGNAYYNKLIKLHEEAKGKKQMKVEDIGGLECAKCHY